MGKQRFFPSANMMEPFETRYFVKSGEYRPPVRGEFFLSGAIPQVYQAHTDLRSHYHIMVHALPPPKKQLNVGGFIYQFSHAEGERE